MKIGYPCQNLSVGCSPSKTFRWKNYSEENFVEKVKQNLSCLKKILEFNVQRNILFFRITSDLIPFASYPEFSYNWQKVFKEEFISIGNYIKKHKIRISMHPDQFVVLNSPRDNVVVSSIRELIYHSEVLDSMELDYTAKIQIHLGGVYENKERSILNFIKKYKELPKEIKNRLVIENDDKNYSLEDCLKVYESVGIPVLFDIFHHKVNFSNYTTSFAVKKCSLTWKKRDGLPMVDYSSQKESAKIGSHCEHINVKDFKNFLFETKDYDFDLMLEIKDKEKSAIVAIEILKKDKRFLIL